MNYALLKKILTVPSSDIWVNRKEIGTVSGAKVYEYSFGGLDMPKVVVRGVETNNPKLQFASQDYAVFVDGEKMNLDKAQYLDVFGLCGYRFDFVQPKKVQQQTQGR
jgi:hypothetical protein